MARGRLVNGRARPYQDAAQELREELERKLGKAWEEIQRGAPDAAAALVALAQGKGGRHSAVRFKAAQDVLNRVYGSPTQRVEVEQRLDLGALVLASYEQGAVDVTPSPSLPPMPEALPSPPVQARPPTIRRRRGVPSNAPEGDARGATPGLEPARAPGAHPSAAIAVPESDVGVEPT